LEKSVFWAKVSSEVVMSMVFYGILYFAIKNNKKELMQKALALANLNGSKIKRGALPYFFTHVIER
jgi:hypothetical protein